MRRLSFSLPALLALILAGATAVTAQTAPYTRTEIVPGNGTPAANGTALLAALAHVCPLASSASHWVIKLEPGIYDVGTTPVVMCEYADLEGSGILESEIRGAFDPGSVGSLVAGLVRGANNTEIRWLTINCLSNATTTNCQALSLDNASPRLTQMRILAQGTGTGSHWGIRTSDSGPILDQVEIQVTASGLGDNYGIVYGDASTLNIKRSSIVARNAGLNNQAIMIKGSDFQYSQMRDSTLTAVGGTRAMGIVYYSSTTTNKLILDNVNVAAHGASGDKIGIGVYPGSSVQATILFQGGRILGATDGVNFGASATVELKHTEIEASRYLAQAWNVRLDFVRVKGAGTVLGNPTAACAAVVNSAGTFLAGPACP